MKLASRIRIARQRAGNISQVGLASRLGVTRGAVANWESGGAVPAAKRLQKLALITGVNFEWLATGRGPFEHGQSVYDALAVDTETELLFDALEIRLIRAYRSIARGERRRVVAYVSQLADGA